MPKKKVRLTLLYKNFFRLPKIFKAAGIALLLFISFHGGAKCSSFENTAFLWFEYGQKINESNGSVTQTVYINSSDDSLDISEVNDLTAFFCNGEQQQEERQYYFIPIEHKDGRCFIRVNTTSPFRYQIYLTGSCQKQHFTAQIAFPLYADNSHNKQEERPALLETIQPFASIEQRSRNAYWWPQTGQLFQFRYKSAVSHGNSVNEITIFDTMNNNFEKIIPDAVGVFSFIPHHDKQLDASGNYGYKELIIYAEEPVGDMVYKTSLNYLVHRSFTAHHDLKAGTSLFFITFTVVLAVVFFRRRRFKY